MVRRGFTIVELLIVIVVIAILAAISLVAYNGMQARAADARMKAGVDQLAKAINLWYIQVGDLPKGGWSSAASLGGSSNCSDGTGGWVAAGTYVCTLEDMLAAEGLVSTGFTRSLPPNTAYGNYTDGRLALMFYPCGSNTGRYALYWHLQAPSDDDAASLAAVEAAGCGTSPRTNYGMKAARLITLN